MLSLIDVVKEAVLRSGCLDVIENRVGRGDKHGPQVLLERLLLVLYAYGTGAGVRAVAAGEHGHTEHHLYYVRRWHLTEGSGSPPRPANGLAGLADVSSGYERPERASGSRGRPALACLC